MSFKIVLEFETKTDADNWVAGYLDGGGEQTLGYTADHDKSVWKTAKEYKLVLKGYRQCPKCRFGEIATLAEWEDRYKECDMFKIKDHNKEYKCQNCGHECNEGDIVN